MSGDFVALKQCSIAMGGTSAPLTIPTNITGFPVGQPLVIKVVTDVKGVIKVGVASDTANATVTSNALADGNFYAYPNAIETYKATSVSANATPTTIHSIATSASGTLDVAFGYYQ